MVKAAHNGRSSRNLRDPLALDLQEFKKHNKQKGQLLTVLGLDVSRADLSGPVGDFVERTLHTDIFKGGEHQDPDVFKKKRIIELRHNVKVIQERLSMQHTALENTLESWSYKVHKKVKDINDGMEKIRAWKSDMETLIKQEVTSTKENIAKYVEPALHDLQVEQESAYINLEGIKKQRLRQLEALKRKMKVL